MYDYRKQLAWAQLRVGIVVTAGLLVLVLTILFAGDIGKLFAPRATLSAAFEDVKGLRSGAPVWFAGVQIGAVRSIQFTSPEMIIVAMTVDRSAFSFLKKDSRASILTLGLLGDKYVELDPGTREAAALKPGDTIAGLTRADMNEELSRLVGTIENKQGSLGRLLRDDKLYLDLAASVKDIRLFAETLKTPEGTLNKFVKDPALYERFLKASDSLDAFTRKLASSKGTVNRLIEDQSLYENVNAAAVKLDVVLGKIDKGEGPLGSLVGDRELKEELRATIKELNSLVKDIREHPKKYFKFSIF